MNRSTTLPDGTVTTFYSDPTGLVRTWIGPAAVQHAREYADIAASRTHYSVTILSAPNKAQVVATLRRAA